MTAFLVDENDGLVRSPVLHLALNVEAPRAWFGTAIAATANRAVADRIAARTIGTKAVRCERLVSVSTERIPLDWGIRTIPLRPGPIHPTMGPNTPGPMGP